MSWVIYVVIAVIILGIFYGLTYVPTGTAACFKWPDGSYSMEKSNIYGARAMMNNGKIDNKCTAAEQETASTRVSGLW